MDDSERLMMVTSYCVTIGMSVDQGSSFLKPIKLCVHWTVWLHRIFLPSREQMIFSPSETYNMNIRRTPLRRRRCFELSKHLYRQGG